MSLAAVAALVAAGVVVGVVSGLVGIGGGVLIVPLLYFVYANPELTGVALDPALHATVAHATSLFVIVPTAVRGTIVYDRSGLVAWRVAVPIAVGSVVAAIAGARLALVLPAGALKLTFGLLLIGSAVRMLVGRGTAERRSEPRDSRVLAGGIGVIVGLLSALLGVGGGLIAIPLLVYVLRLDLPRVAATSLAIVAFAATAGVLTYMVSGWAGPDLPPGHLGYVHLWAGLPVLFGSVAAVRWGARANQRMNVHVLRWTFAVLFLILGVRLVLTNAAALLGR